MPIRIRKVVRVSLTNVEITIPIRPFEIRDDDTVSLVEIDDWLLWIGSFPETPRSGQPKAKLNNQCRFKYLESLIFTM
ncbi:MAG TPA: hypothetical protein VIW47_14240 [Nitrospiraceae bacterium]|jgi:hypothetical protein